MPSALLILVAPDHTAVSLANIPWIGGISSVHRSARILHLFRIVNQLLELLVPCLGLLQLLGELADWHHR